MWLKSGVMLQAESAGELVCKSRGNTICFLFLCNLFSVMVVLPLTTRIFLKEIGK